MFNIKRKHQGNATQCLQQGSRAVTQSTSLPLSLTVVLSHKIHQVSPKHSLENTPHKFPTLQTSQNASQHTRPQTMLRHHTAASTSTPKPPQVTSGCQMDFQAFQVPFQDPAVPTRTVLDAQIPVPDPSQKEKSFPLISLKISSALSKH